MIVLWIAAVVGGLTVAIFASHQTLDSAKSLAERLGLSSFLIGLTVVAIGTDLPEIANSISASATGHGDIYVGDSIGSAVTQVTLVLAILLLIRPIRSDRKLVAVSGAVTVLALLVGALLLEDAWLSRSDGIILFSFWIVGAMAVQRSAYIPSARQQKLFDRGSLHDLRGLVVGLAGVGVGATVAVTAFARVAEGFGMPEYATSFLLLSLGTSLPELVVDAAALRQGEHALALGDLIGSSFVDATLSLGAGPLLFPVAVSASTAVGNLVAAGAIGAAIILLLARKVHRKGSAVVLVAIYAAAYAAILA